MSSRLDDVQHAATVILHHIAIARLAGGADFNEKFLVVWVKGRMPMERHPRDLSLRHAQPREGILLLLGERRQHSLFQLIESEHPVAREAFVKGGLIDAGHPGKMVLIVAKGLDLPGGFRSGSEDVTTPVIKKQLQPAQDPKPNPCPAGRAFQTGLNRCTSPRERASMDPALARPWRKA
jgi:hypothetical protein